LNRQAVIRFLCVLLIVCLCAQVLWHVLSTSPTFDEPYHVIRSFVYLRTGEHRLLSLGGHPPFANLLSVLPLLLRFDIRLPEHASDWVDLTAFRDLYRVADEFFWRIGNDVDGIVLWTRLPVLAMSLLLALLVFVWARDLYGPESGLLALFLFCFDPNIIAHSSLVTTDLGATLLVFGSVFALYRFCRKPSLWRFLGLGVLFGLAQATKFSALFLIPVVVVSLGVWARTKGPLGVSLPGTDRLRGHPLLQQAYVVIVLTAGILVVGSLVVWAVYGFEVGRLVPTEDSHPLLDRYLGLNHPAVRRLVYAVAEALPLPAPSYFAGLAWLRRYATAGHPSFLLGTHGTSGRWWYFPIAFLIKTPIPLLAGLCASLVLWLNWRRRLREEAYLILPSSVFFVASMFSSIDIGYRNILPVLPFLYVLVSKLASLRSAWLYQAILGSLCAWYVVGTLRVAPHYLAYFNESIGGPRQGYRYLVDSNLDWGQDLKHLARYLESEGVDQVFLSYFGTADPSHYGISYQPMPTEPPDVGATTAHYVISATNLQAVYGTADKRGHWLLSYEPVDTVGYSIFVYRLPE